MVKTSDKKSAATKAKEAKAEEKPATPKDWSKYIRIHPDAEEFGMEYSDKQFEVLKLKIAEQEKGLQEPIPLWVDKDGITWAMGGRNRLKACVANGFELIGPTGKPRKEYFKYLPADTVPLEYVLRENIVRGHMTPEQKREKAAKLLKRNPGASNRQVADMLMCIDGKTVAKVRAEMEATAEIPQLETTVGKDGKARPAHRTPRPTADTLPEVEIAPEAEPATTAPEVPSSSMYVPVSAEERERQERRKAITAKRMATIRTKEAEERAEYKRQEQEELAKALKDETRNWNAIIYLRDKPEIEAAFEKAMDTLDDYIEDSGNGFIPDDDYPAEATVAAFDEVIAKLKASRDYAARFVKASATTRV